MPLTLVSAPASEPITTSGVKTFLRVDDTDSDTLIGDLITIARQNVENYTRRALINQTWDYKLDQFPPVTRVPLPPLGSVTHIKYVDTAGATQTLATDKYTVDTDSEPGRIVPAYDEVWPASRAVPNAVRVRYVAGYGANASDVPRAIRHAVEVYVAHWFEHRVPVTAGAFQPAEIPLHVTAHLFPYRAL